MKKNLRTPITVTAIFILLAVLCTAIQGFIGINYDISEYLGDKTQTKQALGIISEEFGMTGNIQLMLSGIDEESADHVARELKSVDHVINVRFDKNDTGYFKDGNALFVILTEGDDYSDNAKAVTAEIREKYDGRYEMNLGGTATEKQYLQSSITGEMVYILAISIALVIIILLITSKSWLEPLILLAASGIAILINKGTNIVFGEISYITNSISAILQLALSIDYSIVLLHTYRREVKENPDGAMKRAIRSVVRPVSASAMTTIAGLLALLFMSFKIGFDIGIVLIKGIVISGITSLTLFPALILIFAPLMSKTEKKHMIPTGKRFSAFALKASKIVVPLGLVLIIVCGTLQFSKTFCFTDTNAANKAIKEIFGSNNTVVVVYPTSDGTNEKETRLAEALSGLKKADGTPILSSYTAYSNTLGEIYDADKAAKRFGIEEDTAKLLFTIMNLTEKPERLLLSKKDFVEFAVYLTENDEDAKALTSASPAFATVKSLYDSMKNSGSDSLSSMPIYKTLTSFLSDETPLSYVDMAKEIKSLADGVGMGSLTEGLGDEIVSAVYAKYSVINGTDLTDSAAASKLIDFLSDSMETNPIIASRMSDDMKKSLSSISGLFRGESYSRMLLSVDLANEGEETDRFIDTLEKEVTDIFGDGAYIAGETVSIHELANTFSSDTVLISVFTIVSIFIIVMLIFKSLSIPTVLVVMIQGAIWITLSTGLIGGAPLFFMSYIVATCILMGATIDYGILLSSNYVTLRKTADRKEALFSAVSSAMPTVFTSGMILTVCSFVIYFISSQISISTVGLLIGKGALISVIIVTCVLPSVLYLLDKFILKLTLGKK